MALLHSKLRPLLAALALTAAVPAHANLIIDGGFEEPAIASGSFAVLTAMTGWTGDPTIEVQRGAAGSAFEGQQFVELDTTANSGMFQDFASVAGAAYRIHFEYSPRPGGAAASNGIEFYFDGALRATIALDGLDNANTVWTSQDFLGLATGSSTRVGFRAVGISDSVGGYIDNVIVTAAPAPLAVVAAVPEPASIALFAIGLIGAAGARRRKSRA